MVNKAVVGVIGVVLIATLGVGALVGLQGGGGPTDDASPDGDDETDGGPQGTATDGTPALNGTQNGTASATPTPAKPDISLSRSDFTAREVEQNLTRDLNAWRNAEGLEPLTTGPGTTKETLRRMAREHSAAMARVEAVVHSYENQSTRDRYEKYDLYTTCSFTRSGGSAIARPGAPDVQVFEWIARTEVDATFSREEGIRFHENESTVANRIVGQWRGNESLQYGLLSSNYRKTGVGVNVTQDGTVYATVHLCGK